MGFLRISFFFCIFLNWFRGVHVLYDSLNHLDLNIFELDLRQLDLGVLFKFLHLILVLLYVYTFFIILRLSFSCLSSNDFLWHYQFFLELQRSYLPNDSQLLYEIKIKSIHHVLSIFVF